MAVHHPQKTPRPPHSGYSYRGPLPPTGKPRVRRIGGPGGEKRTAAELPAIFGPSVREQVRSFDPKRLPR